MLSSHLSSKVTTLQFNLAHTIMMLDNLKITDIPPSKQYTENSSFLEIIFSDFGGFWGLFKKLN